jgi:hypothetical protein
MEDVELPLSINPRLAPELNSPLTFIYIVICYRRQSTSVTQTPGARRSVDENSRIFVVR